MDFTSKIKIKLQIIFFSQSMKNNVEIIVCDGLFFPADLMITFALLCVRERYACLLLLKTIIAASLAFFF